MRVVITCVGLMLWAGLPTSSVYSTDGLKARGIDSAVADLPDDGPRHEDQQQGPIPLLFEEAVAVYAKGNIDFAADLFRRCLDECAAEAAMPSALAYLAESLYRLHASSQYWLDAIELYRKLIREYPASANALRARWRIGDLYAEQKWRVEANTAYEQAIAAAGSPGDQARAMVGLGFNQLGAGQWAAAAQTFESLKGRTKNDDFLQRALRGAADAVYFQKRYAEAARRYESIRSRWPEYFKAHPEIVLRYADAEQALGHESASRQWNALLYNLHPRDGQAPAALVRIGDSYRREGRPNRAELLYVQVVHEHADAPSAVAARMRLAAIGQDRIRAAGDQSLRLEVAAQFRDPLGPPLALSRQEQVFQSVLHEHGHDAFGSEALFHLAVHALAIEQPAQAVQLLREVIDREGQVEGDSWPEEARRRVTALLRPDLLAALRAHDDWHVAATFHRHGRDPERNYAGTEELVLIADAHRRLGFSGAAVKLYQAVVRDPQSQRYKQEALAGLGRTFLDQGDADAAWRVLERYRLEFPTGRLKSEVLQTLAEAWRMAGDAHAVIRICQQWLKLHAADAVPHPAHPDMVLWLAQAQETVQAVADARNTYASAERAGALQDMNARLHYADLLAQDKQINAALMQYGNLAQAAPNSDAAVQARLHMAAISLVQKRYDHVDRLMKQAAGATDDAILRRAIAAMEAVLAIESQSSEG